MRTSIRGGWVVGYRSGHHTLIRDGVVIYEGNEIIHVGPDFDGPVDREIDAATKLVCPGFIDTHVHSGHRASHRLICDVGRPDYFGQPFLEISTTREGTRVGGDPRYDGDDDRARREIELWSRYTVVDLLCNGTTTFVEFGAGVPIQQQLLKDIERFGIRGYLGPGFDDGRWVGGENGRLVREHDPAKGQAEFEQAVEFVTRIDGTVGGRAKGILLPREVELTSLDQIRQTAKLAVELKMPVAIHAAYSILEFYDIVREHLKTPVELLDKLGLLELGPMLNIGHGNFVAEHPRLAYSGGHDIDIMGAHGCSISHCPTNLIRRARFLDTWSKYETAGVNMTLGSDTFPRDLIMQMRMASYMGKLTGKDLSAAPAPAVFEAATVGGARSLGREDLGRLAPGAKADILIIDQHPSHTLRYGPVRDPIKSLVECGFTDDIKTVIVDGVTVMEDRTIPGVDIAALQSEAQQAGQWMWDHWHEWDPQFRTAAQVAPWSFDLWSD